MSLNAQAGPGGTVYGTLFNHPSWFDMLGTAVDAPPYNGAPRAPVLFIKPRNTRSRSGEPVVIPREVPELEVSASLGVVIGRAACRVDAAVALDFISGYAILNDVSVPHASYHRPCVRHKARDGFCPLGLDGTAAARVADPDALEIRTIVDGAVVQTFNTRQMIRSTGRLLSDVTEFMTLYPGDVLSLGAAAPAPRVKAGQVVVIEIDGLGSIANPFVGACS